MRNSGILLPLIRCMGLPVGTGSDTQPHEEPGPNPQAQQTETVQPGVPCSLRAKANAL
jgi:hypothetical protein